MKILFVSLFLPHPYADHASAFTVFRTLRHLSGRHDITLAAFVRSEEEREYVRHLGGLCRRIETVSLGGGPLARLRSRAGLLALTPISVSNSFRLEMRNLIRRLVSSEPFDLAQVEYTPMGQYVGDLGRLPRLINVHDPVYETALQHVRNLGFSRRKMEWLLDSVVCRGYESRLYKRFDRVLAVSESCKRRLLACNPALDITVVPPGVEVPVLKRSHEAGTGRRIIFMGAMWRQENIDAVMYFYHRVFQKVRRSVPDVVFYVVGGGPPEELRALARDPGVVVTGYVDDILPYYLSSDVSVAPVRMAGGIMCKVLDAMAAGLPVVTTPEGNEGVGAEPGREVMVAGSENEFVDMTVKLLKDGLMRSAIGREARKFVERRFVWKHTIERLEKVYEECLSTNARARRMVVS